MARQRQADTGQLAQAALVPVRALLRGIAQATCQINLVRSLRVPSLQNTRHLDITDALANQFKERAASSMTAVLTSIEEYGIGRFNYEALAGARVSAIQIDQMQNVAGWLAQFPADDAVASLGRNDDHITHLQFTHILLTFPHGERLRLFHKTTDARAVTHASGIPMRLAGQRFEPLDRDTTLILDTQIDFFVWNAFLYIVNHRKFESTLNVRDATKERAALSLDAILAAIPVTDPEALKAVLLAGAKNPNKLAANHEAPHIARLSMDKIREVIERRNLPIAVVAIAGVETLNIDHTNKEHIEAYLHVLADDYVLSQITDLEYITIEKTAG